MRHFIEHFDISSDYINVKLSTHLHIKDVVGGFMGSNKICYAIWVIIIIHLSISTFAFAFVDNRHDQVALDSYLHNYTYSVIRKAKIGVLYKADLPANFSGMEVSIVRLLSSTFGARGARFDPQFHIPPRIITMPYARRLEIMYENLGNWSSHYYNLPGYSFLAPIVGFVVYNASLSQYDSNEVLNLTVWGEPITINFTDIVTPELRKIDHKAKCVRFQPKGGVELSQMVSPYVCSSRLQGRFSIATRRVRHPPPPHPPLGRAQLSRRHERNDIWNWWVIGFGVGLVAILLIGVFAIFVCQMCSSRRTRWMERRAEKSEALNTRWIRDSRMPLAYMTRTEATLENDYAP